MPARLLKLFKYAQVEKNQLLQVKMNINKKKIEQVANLSRIRISVDEVSTLREQLTEILDYIEKLKELDTDNIQPMAYVTSLKNVFREDKQESSFTRQEMLELSSSIASGFYKVPKVIE